MTHLHRKLTRLRGRSRDDNSQAPVTTPGMEFVSNPAPVPKTGDTEAEPTALTEEDELGLTLSKIISSRLTSRASKTWINLMI